MQLSVNAGGVQVAVALQEAEAVNVMSVGQFKITGALASVTNTLKEQVVVLFDGSFAVYVTVVVPSENWSPGEWVLVTVTAQLSVNVGGVQDTFT